MFENVHITKQTSTVERRLSGQVGTEVTPDNKKSV